MSGIRPVGPAGGAPDMRLSVPMSLAHRPWSTRPRAATLDPIMDIDLRALAPLLLLAAVLAVYALIDLVRAPAVRYLPKWAWALICVLSMPLGPLAYLTLGRAPR